MKDVIKTIFDTPWKLYLEIKMYLIKPWVMFYLKLKGVEIGKGSKFYGFPKIFKHKNSKIIIGNNFECRSSWDSNPLGVNHPTLICTWKENAVINIGDDVGITGGSIVSAKEITIGDRVLIGANSTIIDTDFHPTKGNKRYTKEGIKSKPVKIGNDVFIGMNCLILKGSTVSKKAIIPAGEVYRNG